MADSLDLGTLSGRIELEDRWTSVLTSVGGSIEKFEESWKEAGATVLTQATSFFTAEAALDAVKEAFHFAVDELKEFTTQGARVAEIESSFNRLTTASGNLSEELLGGLRSGTHNTITDFELMKTVNQDLTAGMNLTNAQFNQLATGGFALARSTGKDVKDVMETINDAMLTGRTRALALLTGKIDLAAAEEKFATSIGTTADRLNGEGKLEAAREAILQKVADAQKRVGDTTDGMLEKTQQISVVWENFQEDLGKTVATSPVLMAGFNAIRDALTEAFGGSQENLVKTIAHEIDSAAITVVEFAKTVVDGVAIAGVEWNALKVVIGTAEQGIRGITYVVEELLLGLMKVANFASGGLAFNDWIKATEKDLDRLYENMSEGEVKIRGYKTAQDDWAVSTGHLNEAITKIEDKMKAAQKAQSDAAQTAKEGAASEHAAAAATEEHAAAADKAKYVIGQTAEEVKKLKAAQDELNSVGKTWQDTLATMNPELVEHVKQLLAAGASASAIEEVYKLTAAQLKAVEMAVKSETEAQKLQTKQLEDSKSRWAEYNSLLVSISGTTTEKQQADIDKWVASQIKAHVDAKTDTKDFYDWVAAESQAMYAKDEQDRLVADSHSKAHFEKIARDAQDAYEFAEAHADQFTESYIRDLEKTAEESKKTADTWSATLGGSLDGVAKKAAQLTQQINTLQGLTLSFTPKGAGTIDQFTIDSTPGGADALLNELAALSRSPVLNPKNVHTFEQQNAYVTALARYNALEAAYNLLISQAKQKHSFADGGVGDFGAGTLAVLHGKEAIIPLGANPSGGIGGNIHNTFYINGTAADVARQVSDTLMRQLKQQRQFGAA